MGRSSPEKHFNMTYVNMEKGQSVDINFAYHLCLIASMPFSCERGVRLSKLSRNAVQPIDFIQVASEKEKETTVSCPMSTRRGYKVQMKMPQVRDLGILMADL